MPDTDHDELADRFVAARAAGDLEAVRACYAPDGRPVAAPACVVAEVRDGRIARIEEYLDSSQAAALAT